MVFLIAILGLAILLISGDALVRGAVNLSLRLGVPALIVSLTVVAFGTSAPEMLIAIQASLEGAPGLALGNVVGSNTANVLLVLGVPAMLAGIQSSHCDTTKNYVFMLAASVSFIALLVLGPLEVMHGVILLTLLAAMLTEAFYSARKSRSACEPDLEEIDEADPAMPSWKIATFLGAGMIGLPIGADILIDAAQVIARNMGVSDAVIGLTLVAVGTSMPELATTVMAAIRRQADVALGNVIGSNMFNLLAIMGVTSMFGPLHVPPGILTFDVWVMLGASVLLAPFVIGRVNITRIWGVIFTAAYAAYMVVLLI